MKRIKITDLKLRHGVGYRNEIYLAFSYDGKEYNGFLKVVE